MGKGREETSGAEARWGRGLCAPAGAGVGGGAGGEMQEGSEEGTSDPKPTTSKYQVGKLRFREGLGMPGAKGFKDGQEEANVTCQGPRKYPR